MGVGIRIPRRLRWSRLLEMTAQAPWGQWRYQFISREEGRLQGVPTPRQRTNCQQQLRGEREQPLPDVSPLIGYSMKSGQPGTIHMLIAKKRNSVGCIYI